MARLIAEPMTRTLGQQVIVENVAGAGGTLAAGREAKADPDGYTLLVHHIGLASSVGLYRKLPYDPATAFAPIGRITDVPMTVVGKADLQPGSVGELLDYIRANGEQIIFAHGGVGAVSHLCGLLLMDALGTKMTAVGYKGSGPAMTDLLGGQVDMTCDQTTNTVSHIKSGKIKTYTVVQEDLHTDFFPHDGHLAVNRAAALSKGGTHSTSWRRCPALRHRGRWRRSPSPRAWRDPSTYSTC